MAEEKTSAEISKLTKAEQAFNRQINFFVMRYMWQRIRGRSPWNSGDTVYNALNIRRERFTRVIDAGTIRYGKGELDWLEKTTGIQRKIFTGEVHFACGYVLAKNDGVEVITEDRWHRLFDWRKEMKEARAELGTMDQSERSQVEQAKKNIEELAKGKEIQERVCRQLELARRTKEAYAKRTQGPSNVDFRHMCYFFEKREAAPTETVTEAITDIEQAINALGVEMLEQCTDKQLQGLSDSTSQWVALINSILVYRKAKRKNRRK